MMAKKSPWEGIDLAGSIAPNGPLDQQLFQSRPRPARPASHNGASTETETPGNKETSLLASQEASKEEYPLPSPPQKATFALPAEVLDALEDIKRELRRTYGIKLSKERIVAEAILRLASDLTENKSQSILVNKFSSKEGNK